MQHIGNNSSHAGAKLAITAEQAASSAHHAIDQLSAVARPAISRATSSAHHMVDRIGDTTDRVAHRLEDTAARLKESGQHLVGASSGYVRDHPLATIGIALAAGFLVSRLTASHRPADESAQAAPPPGASDATTTGRRQR